ncbi:MAG TPA: hypothetical protein VKM55_07555 [Candidatus Lokiarchaeia archaeon]|nr:hypothetical protein [Candidatus Lokiarchaeia archaeon]
MADSLKRFRLLVIIDFLVGVIYAIYLIIRAYYENLLPGGSLEKFFYNCQVAVSMLAICCTAVIALKRNTKESLSLVVYLAAFWIFAILVVNLIFHVELGMYSIAFIIVDDLMLAAFLVLNIGVILLEKRKHE